MDRRVAALSTDVSSNQEENAAEIEDADVEMPIAAFITQEATSFTGAPTVFSAAEETRSDANLRGNRRVINTEEF